jgi:ribosomal-protein-alanine N-acetyltransferase
MPENIGSGRVMEKAGLSYEGTLRGYFLKDGVFPDAVMYAIIRDEG